MSAMITLEHVSFLYTDETDPTNLVLRDVSLSIESGSFVTILGHNGSGKSTLAKLLNAIETPTEGTVTVCGLNTSLEENLYAIRSSVGMVFQNPDNQIVASVVEEDVAFAPENMGVAPAEIRRRVDDALHAVGMYDYRSHAPHLLSGGQKQRIAIAGVLAMQPQCLVLDESTAMLDPVGRREIMDTIRRLNRDSGMTVILITHHMDEAAQSDRVIVMNEGEIIADDHPTQVFQQVETLNRAGLSVPDTVKLLHALHGQGFDPPLDAMDNDACAAALWALLCADKP